MFKVIQNVLLKKWQRPNIYVGTFTILICMNVVFGILMVVYSEEMPLGQFFSYKTLETELFFLVGGILLNGMPLDHCYRIVPRKILIFIFVIYGVAAICSLFIETPEFKMILILIPFGILAFIWGFNVVIQIKIDLMKMFAKNRSCEKT